MALWDVCIRRPVFTAMLMAAPIVLGIFSYFRLGVDLFPDVDIPVVIISTTLRGASVEEMETNITKLIEETVNTANKRIMIPSHPIPSHPVPSHHIVASVH